MSNAVATQNGAGQLMESVLVRGDLSKLNAQERAQYYLKVCESVGLNPLTKPMEYITLNGKLTLYALRACTDQLRAIHKVSVVDLTESERDGVFIVTAKMQNGEGRTDMAKGAVTIANLKGDALANAIMKAETKAKRRATLSLCGLGILDETEIETIPTGNGRAQTLPKKDAKDIYTKMQREVDALTSRDALQKWGEENKERIAVLPEDWQDILRIRYKEKSLDLLQQETKELGDPLDIPPMLRRTKPDAMPNPGDDIVKWLQWLDGRLSAMKSADEMESFWAATIAPVVDAMFPPDQVDAYAVYDRHTTRLSA